MSASGIDIESIIKGSTPVRRKNRKEVRRTEYTDPLGKFSDVLLNIRGLRYNSGRTPRPAGDLGVENVRTFLEAFLANIRQAENRHSTVDDMIFLLKNWNLRVEEDEKSRRYDGDRELYVGKGVLMFSKAYAEILLTAGELPYSRFGNDPAFEGCSPYKNYLKTGFVSMVGDIRPMRTKGMPERMVIWPRCWPVYHTRANGVVEYVKPVKVQDIGKTAIN